jgi:hypothetical protein
MPLTLARDCACPRGAWPAFGNDAITFVGIPFDPVLPTERGHPKAVDENNRGDIHSE